MKDKNFWDKFPMSSRFSENELFDLVDRSYCISNTVISKFIKARDNAKDILEIEELYERLLFQPHSCFLVEVYNSLILKVSVFEEQLLVNLVLDTGEELEDYTIQTRLELKRGGLKRPKLTSSETRYFFEDVECSLHYKNRGKEPKLNNSQKKTIILRTLEMTKAALDIIYEQPKEVEIGKFIPCALSSKDNVFTYKPTESPDEYIKSKWLTAREYRNSNREGRIAIQSRKRQHEVSGHWRFYQSGKKIFIKAHKRGDASLGTVKTHMVIK